VFWVRRLDILITVLFFVLLGDTLRLCF